MPKTLREMAALLVISLVMVAGYFGDVSLWRAVWWVASGTAGLAVLSLFGHRALFSRIAELGRTDVGWLGFAWVLRDAGLASAGAYLAGMAIAWLFGFPMS